MGSFDHSPASQKNWWNGMGDDNCASGACPCVWSPVMVPDPKNADQHFQGSVRMHFPESVMMRIDSNTDFSQTFLPTQDTPRPALTITYPSGDQETAELLNFHWHTGQEHPRLAFDEADQKWPTITKEGTSPRHRAADAPVSRLGDAPEDSLDPNCIEMHAVFQTKTGDLFAVGSMLKAQENAPEQPDVATMIAQLTERAETGQNTGTVELNLAALFPPHEAVAYSGSLTTPTSDVQVFHIVPARDADIPIAPSQVQALREGFAKAYAAGQEHQHNAAMLQPAQVTEKGEPAQTVMHALYVGMTQEPAQTR